MHNYEPNPFKNAKIDDPIKFGNYPQSANGQNQPIEWQVLSIENNKMLVISRYGLDAKRFNGGANNWKNSEISQWLNNYFYNIAFTDQEKKFINSSNLSDVGTTDNVFCLSYDEVKKYFANDNARLCEPTDYAKKNVANVDNGRSWWWLRSPNGSRVYYVNNFDGTVDYFAIEAIYNSYFIKPYGLLRPAMWINI